MTKKHKTILFVAMGITAGLFLLDDLYLDPVVQFSFSEYLQDICIAGTMYTTIFYVMIYCITFLVGKVYPGK